MTRREKCGARETTTVGVFTCDRDKGHENIPELGEWDHAAYGLHGRIVWTWEA